MEEIVSVWPEALEGLDCCINFRLRWLIKKEVRVNHIVVFAPVPSHDAVVQLNFKRPKSEYATIATTENVLFVYVACREYSSNVVSQEVSPGNVGDVKL